MIIIQNLCANGVSTLQVNLVPETSDENVKRLFPFAVCVETSQAFCGSVIFCKNIFFKSHFYLLCI